MTLRIILIAAGISTLASCGTAYRTGQTPDDVYYSPAREAAAYVQADNNNGQRYQENTSRNNSNDYYSPDDNYLRMMVYNRNRWSTFNDYYDVHDWNSGGFSLNYGTINPWSYSYNPWSYSYYNNYWNWNSCYNPYYPAVVVVNPKMNPAQYNKIRNFNLNSYTNRTYYTGSNGQKYFDPHSYRSSSTAPGSNTLGSSIKKVFSNSNSNAGKDSYYTPSSNDRPTRTYTPSSNNNSSTSPSSSGGSRSSSGGSSGGGVSRPSRG